MATKKKTPPKQQVKPPKNDLGVPAMKKLPKRERR
jgi:hypothetical protein